MRLTPDMLEELNTLLRFDLATSLQGIKIHADASDKVISATQRLHAMGLVTRPDGGYLTPLGRDAAEQLQLLVSILTSRPNGANAPVHCEVA